jgi:RNA polymerase sigma-B factor
MTSSLKEPLKLNTLELLGQYRKGEDIHFRNKILELNMGLVRKEASHWNKKGVESFEDLLQVGCLGMIRAIERFDLHQGHAFSSFAMPYIRGEIQHYLRDKRHSMKIPRRWLEMSQKSVAIKQDFLLRFNRQPKDRELADLLGISRKEWQEIKLAIQNREPLSLDMPVGNEEDGQTSLGDRVVDSKYHSFQLAQEDQIRLQQALAELEEHTRQVLEFVFLKDLTQQEAAKQLGISVVTVARRIKSGIARLQECLALAE